MSNKCTHSGFIVVPLPYPDARILWKCHACSAFNSVISFQKFSEAVEAVKTDVQDERDTLAKRVDGLVEAGYAIITVWNQHSTAPGYSRDVEMDTEIENLIAALRGE